MSTNGKSPGIGFAARPSSRGSARNRQPGEGGRSGGLARPRNFRAEFGVDERSVWPVVERIFNLIKAKFPEHEITPLNGGGTNALYLLERNGIRTVLKIAMISNFNAGVEEECLHILNRSRFAPRLYERFEIDGRTGLRIE